LSSLRVAFAPFLAAAVLAGPAAAAPIDKAKLDQERSAVAEAAAVAQLSASGRISSTYAAGLTEDLTKNLEKLAREPAFSAVASRALTAIARRDAAALAALRDELVMQERVLGRAP
jgi:hypothetical protein